MRIRVRRGQAEVLGGLIILTILIVLVLPIILQTYNDVTRLSEEARKIETRFDLKTKEKLTINGVRQDQVSPDFWPGIWINNTGTVQVTLRIMYLIDQDTGTILAALDLNNARPATSNLIDQMCVNPLVLDPTQCIPPPVGQPITLKPGDKLYIAFNDAHPALLNPEKIIIRILSATGVLHPQAGGESQGLLVPPPEASIEFEPWKGAFSPYAGFKLIGGDELLANGVIKAFVPKIVLTRPIDTRFYSTFIYDDDMYPGLYRITLEPRWDITIRTNYGNCYAWGGSFVEFRGFLGTYHFYTDSSTGREYVYINGYAADIRVDGSSCFGNKGIKSINPSGTYEVSDFDANGVSELVIYSLKNGPNYGYSSNPDADGRGNSYDDTLVWSYISTRDISGQDFVRITLKINYYWTRIAFGGASLDPSRDLRTFMITIWEYDPFSNQWILRHYKDFSYTSEKPKQYQFSTVFPLDRTKTYRVGISFFDSYRILEHQHGDDDTALEFTYALEYLVVEYGRYNPLFSRTPPVYIVAIPDPAKISNIGELEYALIHGISLNDAKIQAQAELLELVKQSLEDAGLTDYVVINTTTKLCDILFSPPSGGLPDTPPRNAVIIWLQGDKSVSQVSGCAGNNKLKNYIKNYHWVFAQVSGEPMWGSVSTFASGVTTYTGNIGMNITPAGLAARMLYKAYSIPIEAEFSYSLTVSSSSCMVANATFYYNVTFTPDRYGTLGFWIDCNPDPASSGIIVVNPVDIDWAEDGGGVVPDAVAQIVTYAALEAYRVINP